MGFSAAGFFGQINADITDQRQYIRARVEEDRTYLRQQGLQRQAAIQEQRSTYERAAQVLIRRGADERTVLGTLEMDPEGILQILDTVQNDSSITGDTLNDMFSISADYSSEATMSEILNTILPAAQALPEGTDPVTSRRRSIASWLGLDLDEELTNEVYNQQIVGGMTGDQILAGIGQPVQARGTNADGVTYSMGSVVPLSGNDVAAFTTTALEDYNLPAMIADLEAAKTVDGADQADLTAQINELERIKTLGPRSRLNAILALPGIVPGENTLGLANAYGNRLFNSDNLFSPATIGLLLGVEPAEAGTDGTPAALGDPAVETPTPTTGRPDLGPLPAPAEDNPGIRDDGSVVRPQGRAPNASQINTIKDNGHFYESASAAVEGLELFFATNPDVEEVTIMVKGDQPEIMRREDVAAPSLEKMDDALGLQEALDSGDRRLIAERAYEFQDKYGVEAVQAIVPQGADGWSSLRREWPGLPEAGTGAAGDLVRSELEANSENVAMVKDFIQRELEASRMNIEQIKAWWRGDTPESEASVPATEEEAVERDADEATLAAALSREGGDQAELEAVLKDFIEKYDLTAARDVIGRGVN